MGTEGRGEPVVQPATEERDGGGFVAGWRLLKEGDKI